MEKRFELRQGDRVLAWLMPNETDEVTLGHYLSENEMSMTSQVVPFDDSGNKLKVDLREENIVSFSDNTGVQLKLSVDKEMFLKVHNAKGLVRLRAAIPQSDPGSGGDQPIHDSHLVLEIVPKKFTSN